MDKFNKNNPSPKKNQSALMWLGQHKHTILGWLMIIAGGASLFCIKGVLRNLIEVLPYLCIFVLGLFLIYFGLCKLRCTKVTSAISKKASEYKKKYFGD